MRLLAGALMLLGLQAIGIADGLAGNSLPSSTQSPITRDNLPRSTQSPVSRDAPPRAIPSPDKFSRRESIRGESASTRAVIVARPDIVDFYPAESVRLQEEGRPQIRICWGKDGVVSGTTVVETSGYSRLDAAAAAFGRQYRMKPGTENGAPVAGCATQAVIFTLRPAGPHQ